MTITGSVPAGLRLSGGPNSLVVRGELTVRTCWQVREALCALDAAHEVLIDLSGVDRLDASGLVAVTAPAVALRRRGVRLVIHLPHHPGARRVADLAGVVPMLAVA